MSPLFSQIKFNLTRSFDIMYNEGMSEGDIDTGGLTTLEDALKVIQRNRHPHPDTKREYQTRDAAHHAEMQARDSARRRREGSAYGSSLEQSDLKRARDEKFEHGKAISEYVEQHGAAPPTTWGAPGVEPRTVLHKVVDRQEQEFQQTLARGQAEAAVFGEQKNPAHIQLTPDQQILADRLKVIQHPRAAEFMRRLNEGLPVSVAMVDNLERVALGRAGTPVQPVEKPQEAMPHPESAHTVPTHAPEHPIALEPSLNFFQKIGGALNRLFGGGAIQEPTQ